MCRIYASTDPKRYESLTRSLRLNGFVTSVRLENEFWDVLTEMAGEQGLSPSQFIAQLHDEVEDECGEVHNLTSLLRVACTVYLKRQIVDPDAAAAGGVSPHPRLDRVATLAARST